MDKNETVKHEVRQGTLEIDRIEGFKISGYIEFSINYRNSNKADNKTVAFSQAYISDNNFITELKELPEPQRINELYLQTHERKLYILDRFVKKAITYLEREGVRRIEIKGGVMTIYEIDKTIDVYYDGY